MASNVDIMSQSAKRSPVGRLAALLGLGMVAVAVNACQTPLPGPKEPESPSCPEQPPIAPQCLLWSRAQEPLAKLGLEALKLGRIDAGLYSFDPVTKMVRVSPALQGERTALSLALAEINQQIVTRDALETAFRKASLPGELVNCPAKTYAVKVYLDPKTPERDQMYRWEFTGDKPSEEQLRDCFQAFYGTPPEGCKLAASVYADQSCLQLKGLYPEEIETDDRRAAESSFHVNSAGTCGNCKLCGNSYKYRLTNGSCGSC